MTTPESDRPAEPNDSLVSPAPAPEPTPEPAPEPEIAPAETASEITAEPVAEPVAEDASQPASAPAPAPMPTRPTPPLPSAVPVPSPRPPAPRPASTGSGAGDPQRWGRVADDGSVYVRTPDGERLVGQVPDATPQEALSFFTRKYDELAFEVELLEQRVGSGTVSPEDASGAVKKVRATLSDAKAVGDLQALSARLDALGALIGEQREARKAERAKRLAEAKETKERIADEAERLAAGSDWRNGANRLRELLDDWKALPRLDKAVDDSLWRRFSTARTTYTRRRKAHFAELNEQRESAKTVKERLVKEAEALATSTDWGATAATYRDLMRQWKAAGPAPKGIDDALWKRFRAAQDTFFGARDEATAAQDAELSGNATKKEALLAEAEALLPIGDLASAKAAFRGIAERWDAAGKVPRERMKDLEGRLRKVEQAIRSREEDAWRRSNPEARARAEATVAQLEASLDDLRAKHTKATAAGNTKKAEEHASAIAARESWLAEAQKALEEFSG